jgi:hypothetical protein
MTKQELLELYGQSVYQIRLQLAIHFYCAGKNVDGALQEADGFVVNLLGESTEEVKARFQ